MRKFYVNSIIFSFLFTFTVSCVNSSIESNFNGMDCKMPEDIKPRFLTKIKKLKQPVVLNQPKSLSTIIEEPRIKLGSIESFKKVCGNYPPKNPMDKFFRLDDFVMTTLDSWLDFKEDFSDNTLDLKEKSKVIINNGRLYYASNKKLISVFEGIYATDKNGELYISNNANAHHSYFLKKDFIGKPVSCAGRIETDELGKIKRIDNSSGHYKPNVDQLLLLILELSSKMSLSNDFSFNCEDFNDKMPFLDKLILDIKENKNAILDSYNECSNYDEPKVKDNKPSFELIGIKLLKGTISF